METEIKTEIKKCITHCKTRKYAGIIGFSVLWILLCTVFSMSMGIWFGILFSLAAIFVIIIGLSDKPVYFTFDYTKTNISYGEIINQNKSLSYNVFEKIEESDEKDKMNCGISYIDGKYMGKDGTIILTLPKNRIFKVSRFFWNQKIKSIDNE